MGSTGLFCLIFCSRPARPRSVPAKRNYVDHTILDTTSILRFIEDNWQTGADRLTRQPNGVAPGQGSFDQLARPINGLFDFDRDRNSYDFRPLLLNDSTGETINPNRP